MALTPSHQVDSPWSWVILACSFLCLFCFSLLGTSVGMAQVEMIEDLQFGAGAISIMTSFAVGLSTLLGPLSGAIASVLSMRFTIIIGTILMSIGMLCTAFSHSLPVLLFFYGIVTGLGHGIAYSPCVVIVHHYFRNKLILANGILTSASSFAMLSLPYLHRYILDEYGWRLLFARNAALLLHIIVFASFFVPTPVEKMTMVSLNSCLSREGDASKNGSECEEEDDNNDVDFSKVVYNDDNTREGKEKQDNEDDDDNDNGGYDYGGDDGSLKSGQKYSEKCIEEKLFLSKESITSRKMNMLIKSTDNISLGSKTLSLTGPTRPYIPVYINGTPKLRSPVSELIAAHSPSLRRSLNSEDGDLSRCVRDRSVSQVSSVSALTLDDPSMLHIPTTTTATAIDITNANIALKSPVLSLKPRKFGQLRKGSRSHLGSSLVFASSDLGSSIMLPTMAIEEMKMDGDGDDGGGADVVVVETMMAKMKRIAGRRQLWLFCLNALFFMCGCGTHSIHLPLYVASKGVAPHLMANIYSVLGVVIALGRVCGGMVYNRLKLPLIPLLFVLQLLNGLLLMLAPFYASDVSGIFCMEIGIGLTYGQAYMIQAPIATQVVGIQDLAIAFGFIQLFNGIGYIGAPIMAGYIYDATKTFDIPMHIAGAIVSLGSFFILAMWFTNDKDQGKEDASCEMTRDDNDEDETAKSKALIGGEENV